jgi:hypothetical protein
MDINQITTNQIAALDKVEFANLITKINRAKEIQTNRIKNQFEVGDNVFFYDKRGMRQEGSINKICAKNIKLMIGTTKWTVHPSFLQKV